MRYATAAEIIGVSIIAAVGATTSASASETTAYHGDAEYTTVLWSAAPHTDGSTPYPQQYVQEAPGNNQYVYGLSTIGLACGTFYQADVYRTADVATIAADKTLTEGEDYGKAIQWTTFTTAPCAPTSTGSATPTPSSTPTSNPTSQPTSTPSAEPTPTSTPPDATNAPTPPTTPPATTTPAPTPTQTASPTPVGTTPAQPGPPTTVTPAPTGQPTAPPSHATAPVGTTKPTPRTADRSDASTHPVTSLAYTGSDVNKPLRIGSLILVAGLILLLAGRALQIRKTLRAGRTNK